MKYVKKPITIEADVYEEGMEDGFITTVSGCVTQYTSYRLDESSVPYIETLEGKMFIRKGDYIITGIAGERYPCKPDIFNKTYERVD